MLDYAPVAQISSIVSKGVSLTHRLPWIYLIACLADKVVYVGETYDSEGILIRLGSHFGPFAGSTLKQRASQRAAVSVLAAPFLIVAARLPSGDEDAGFDGASTTERRLCESALQQLVIERFVLKTPGWVVVSETSSGARSPTPAITAASLGIFSNFMNAYSHYKSLASTAPFHFVVLDPHPHVKEGDVDLGKALDLIETSVFTWITNRLRRRHGDAWWREAIPTEVRVDCQARRERNAGGKEAPAEAYMMLIDLKSISKKNWMDCAPLMEAVSNKKGREAATAWIQELSEIRNLWAHPVRRGFVPLDREQIAWLRTIADRCQSACRA